MKNERAFVDFFQILPNRVDFFAIFVRAYAQSRGEVVESLFTGVFIGPFHAEFVTPSATLALFWLGLQCNLRPNIRCLKIIFGIVFVNYELYGIFGGFGEAREEFLQFFEAAEIFFAGVNIRVVILNRDVKNLREVFNHIRGARTTASMEK